MIRPAFALLLLFVLAAPARARWPYQAEEASNLAEGRWEVSGGVSRTVRERERRFYGMQLLTPPRGVHWNLPEVEATVGVGSRAEMSVQYAYHRFEPEGGGAAAYQSGDVRLWTKLGLVRGAAVAVSGRFGVKLPNGTDKNGLGTDETDVYLSALCDLRLGPALLSLNAGIGVLGDPSKNQSQDDVFTWAGAVRVPVAGGWSLGLDGGGYFGPFGVDRQRDLRTYAGVVSWETGSWRLDAAGRLGVRDAEGWGAVAGLTYQR